MCYEQSETDAYSSRAAPPPTSFRKLSTWLHSCMSHCLCSLHLVFFLAVLCYPFPIVLAAVVPRTAAQMNQIQMSVHVCVCVCVCFNTSTFPLTRRLFFVPLPPPGGLLRKSYNSLSYYPRRKDLIYLLPLKSTSLSALFFSFFFYKEDISVLYDFILSFLFFKNTLLCFSKVVRWGPQSDGYSITEANSSCEACRAKCPPPGTQQTWDIGSRWKDDQGKDGERREEPSCFLIYWHEASNKQICICLQSWL